MILSIRRFPADPVVRARATRVVAFADARWWIRREFFGMRKLTATEAQDLCEILEERSFGKSTVFTTQLPLDHWAEVIADPVIADAIRDRLQHAALVITITGESYRGVKARKLAAGSKPE